MNWSKMAPPSFIMDSQNKWVRNWFSNMVDEPIEIDGILWPSTENYYQSHKTCKPEEIELFKTCTPARSKALGRRVELREDWEIVKENIMMKGLIYKFSLDHNKKLLLDTKDSIIVEWNNWNDGYWGVDVRTFIGLNRLGALLMTLRCGMRENVILPPRLLTIKNTSYR